MLGINLVSSLFYLIYISLSNPEMLLYSFLNQDIISNSFLLETLTLAAELPNLKE